MKIFITGATGFIGTNLIRKLSQNKKNELFVLARKGSDLSQVSDLDFNVVRYLNFGEIAKALPRDIQLVFNLAGMIEKWNSPESHFWQANYYFTKKLLELTKCWKLKRFVHCSTAGVIGPLPEGVIADELTPCSPSNIYEKTKREAEKLVLQSMKKGLAVTIIRPEFVYGSYDFHTLKLFRLIKKGFFILINGGNSYLHPTYIDDVVEGMINCLKTNKTEGEIYLLAGPNPLKVKEIIRIVAQEMNVDLKYISLPEKPMRILALPLEAFGKMGKREPPLTNSKIDFFVQNRAFKIDKAKKDFAWEPKFSFSKGIRATIRWYQENGYL